MEEEEIKPPQQRMNYSKWNRPEDYIQESQFWKDMNEDRKKQTVSQMEKEADKRN